MKDVFPTIDTANKFMIFVVDNKDVVIELAEISLVMVGDELLKGRLVK